MSSVAGDTRPESLKRKSPEGSLDLQASPSRRRKLDQGLEQHDNKAESTVAVADNQILACASKVAADDNIVTPGTDLHKESQPKATPGQGTCLSSWERSLDHYQAAQKESATKSSAASALPEKTLSRTQPDDRSEQNSCIDTRESGFDDVQTARKVFELLVANVETFRALQMWSARMSTYQDVVNGLTEGLNELCEHLEVLQSSGKPTDHPSILKLANTVERHQAIVKYRQDQQDEAVVEANAEFRALRRQGDTMYACCKEISLSRFLIFRAASRQFFTNLEVCRDLHSHYTELQNRLAEAREQQDGKRDEILEAVSNLVRAHQADASDRATVLFRRDDMSQLRSMPELLAVDKQYEALVLQAEGAKDELCQAEIEMYNSAEAFLMEQSVLGPRTEDSSDPLEDPLNNVPVSTGPSNTPRGATSAAQQPEGPSFVKQLTKGLERELKRQYDLARRSLEERQEELESLRDLDDLKLPEKALATSANHALFLAKRQRTRKVLEAEKEFVDIRKRAQDAGIAGIPAKSTGFSSHASDGYSAGTVDAHIKLTNGFEVEK